MDLGYPCNLTTSLTNTSTIGLVVYECFHARKCAYLLSLSTTIKITSKHVTLDNPSIKIIDISLYTASRIPNGINKHARVLLR